MLNIDAAIPPFIAKLSFLSNRTLGMIPIWACVAFGAALPVLPDNSAYLQVVVLLLSVLCFFMLWFSLQWDILRHYAPQADIAGWRLNSGGGLVGGIALGLVAGGCLFMSGLMTRPAPSHIDNVIILAAAGGLTVGCTALGGTQAESLRGYIRGAGWWLLGMALAWVPPYLLLDAFTALNGDFAGSALPYATTISRAVVAEGLLLSLPLALFWWLARRSKAEQAQAYRSSTPDQPHVTLPLAITRDDIGRQVRDVLIIPLLVAAVALALYWFNYTGRVDRMWLEPGDPTYLRFAADHLVTVPRQDEGQAGAGQAPGEFQAGVATTNVVRPSPDGRYVATGTGATRKGDSDWQIARDHAVHIFSTANSSELFHLNEPRMAVLALAWSPDSRYLAAGGGMRGVSAGWLELIDPDTVLRVWRIDGAKPELVRQFVGHNRAIEALAWSESGRLLASRDGDNRIVVWKVP